MARFVRAWESSDLDALIALLTDDVFVSMPPMPFEYEGRDVVAHASAPPSSVRDGDSTSCRREPIVSPHWGPTCRAAHGLRHGTGLFVLTLTGDRICAMTRFDKSVLPSFGLPRSLPRR